MRVVSSLNRLVRRYGSDPKCWAPSTRNAPALGESSGGDGIIRYGPWDSRQTWLDEGYSEFIELEFETAVYATSVTVGTCRGPHSIVSIKAKAEGATDAWHPVWAGAPDPAKEAFLRRTKQRVGGAGVLRNGRGGRPRLGRGHSVETRRRLGRSVETAAAASWS